MSVLHNLPELRLGLERTLLTAMQKLGETQVITSVPAIASAALKDSKNKRIEGVVAAPKQTAATLIKA